MSLPQISGMSALSTDMKRLCYYVMDIGCKLRQPGPIPLQGGLLLLIKAKHLGLSIEDVKVNISWIHAAYQTGCELPDGDSYISDAFEKSLKG